MWVKQVEDAARTMGRSVIVLSASNDNEIDLAIATLIQRGADALLMSADLFFQIRRNELVALAARRLSGPGREFQSTPIVGPIQSVWTRNIR